MIDANHYKKRYSSAKRRFLEPIIAQFFSKELSSAGPEMSRMLANRIVTLMEAICPDREQLKPGQLLWMALDKTTRAGSKNETLKPVVLTLINEAEAAELSDGASVIDVRKEALARMCREAFDQNAVLSMRDLAMIFHISASSISTSRKEVEAKLDIVLPHTGVLHDMGTCITHKIAIIRKVVCEKMDPADVARATCHTQKSVDTYLKAFYRVQTLCDYNQEPDFISQVTGMTTRLVKEYIEIIRNIETHEN